MQTRNAVLATLALSLCGTATAALSYNGGVYSQNFDTLANSPENTTATWTDDTTIPGWYSDEILYRIEDGSQTNSNLYSFGSVAASDRALGSIAGGTPGIVFYGLQLTNSGPTTYDRFAISYTGEEWRETTAAQNTLEFQYSLTATSVSSGAGYTTASNASFSAPKFGTATGALNGNLAANQTTIATQVFLSGNWTPGNTLWLRIRDPDDTGSDQGLGIDDFSVYFFPEPSSAMLLAAGAALLIRRRRS